MHFGYFHFSQSVSRMATTPDQTPKKLKKITTAKKLRKAKESSQFLDLFSVTIWRFQSLSETQVRKCLRSMAKQFCHVVLYGFILHDIFVYANKENKHDCLNRLIFDLYCHTDFASGLVWVILFAMVKASNHWNTMKYVNKKSWA